jgi:hypothetical protein
VNEERECVRERKRLSKKKRKIRKREREGAKRHVDHSLNCLPFVKID